MRFTKMQGAGNDYVYVDTFTQEVSGPAGLARRISDRHFGVGGDGLILIAPPRSVGHDGANGESGAPACRMEMYNADGSRAEMCGNGLRCVAKYVFDRGIAAHSSFHVETDAGVKTCRVVSAKAGAAESIELDMGRPQLHRVDIPLLDGGDPNTAALQLPMNVDGATLCVSAVSMGNPHAIVRLGDSSLDDPSHDALSVLGDLETIDLPKWGPCFEHHSWFPERVNTEFIVVHSPTEISLRVWERGSGETLACGTGACAAVVAAVLNGWCEPETTVHLRGGDLRIRWEQPGVEQSGSVYLTGPAVEVFTGEWPE